MSRRNDAKRQDDFIGVCSSCKTSYSCCHNTNPPIHSERKKTIEEWLKAQKTDIRNPFAHAVYSFPKVNDEGYCVFQDKKTRMCLIHSVKPETCVAGPVTFGINVRSGRIEWFLKTEKLCQLAVLLYNDEQRLRNHLDSAKKEIWALVCKLDTEALKALLKIEEPDTFKIDEDPIGTEILDRLVNH